MSVCDFCGRDIVHINAYFIIHRRKLKMCCLGCKEKRAKKKFKPRRKKKDKWKQKWDKLANKFILTSQQWRLINSDD